MKNSTSVEHFFSLGYLEVPYNISVPPMIGLHTSTWVVDVFKLLRALRAREQIMTTTMTLFFTLLAMAITAAVSLSIYTRLPATALDLSSGDGRYTGLGFGSGNDQSGKAVRDLGSLQGQSA